MEIDASDFARTGFQHGAQVFVGCAGVGGRFEHDERTGGDVRGDLAAGVEDVGNVGFAVFAERRWYADDHRIALGD